MQYKSKKNSIKLNREMTKEEWNKTGRELYGENVMEWKFVCPACGKTLKVKDYKKKGLHGYLAYLICTECNWKAYDLLGSLGKGIYIEDINREVFSFADL